MTAKKKLTSAERSKIAKEAWARRMAAQQEKAAVTEGEKREVIVDPESTEVGEVLVLHFLTDGFTAMGKTWYRGEELSIRRGSEEWKSTQDRNGRTWLEFDEEEQVKLYGVVHFRAGAWPGKPLMSEEEYRTAISESDQEAIRRYEKQQARTARPSLGARS